MLHHALHLLQELLPVFFIAIIASSVIDKFIPDSYFKNISDVKNINLGIVLAAVIGSLIPICTCGMIPLAIKLKDKGLSWQYLASFLTAGNANSIPAMILTFTLGFKPMLFRFVASVVFGVLTTWLISFLVNKDFDLKIKSEKPSTDCCAQHSLMSKVWDDLKEMTLSFLPWILVAVAIAAFIHQSIHVDIGSGEGIAGSLFGHNLAPFFAGLVGFPFYFCAGADVPISSELLGMGVSLGTVVTFMLASPGINLTSLLVYQKAIGLRQASIYLLLSYLVVSIIGLAINF